MVEIAVIAITTNRRRSWSNTDMNTRYLRVVGAAFAMAVGATGVYADEIYKWTDEDGNVHYGDRPSGELTEERLQYSYNRTDSDAVNQRVQAHRDSTAARRDARAEREEAKRTAAEERAAAKEREARCRDYRSKMELMLASRRLYREDENGERVYLDDVQTAEARQKAEELIKENCSD